MMKIDRRAALFGGAFAVAGTILPPLARAKPREMGYRNDMHAWTPAEFHRARRYVTLDEGRIAYVEHGRGPAALLIHGWPLNGFQWRHVMARVGSHRRCVAPDLMGLGYSEVPEAQRLCPRSQAAMLSKLMQRLQIDQFDLIANDSGTAIAQLLATSEPHRVRSMLLTNGDVHTNSPPAFLAPALEAARKGELAEMFEAHLKDPDFASSPEGLGSICYEDPATLGPASCDVYFSPLIANARRRAQGQRYGVEFEPNPLPALEERLHALRIPARMVWGLSDPIFDVRWAEWLDQKLPMSTGITRLPRAKLFFPEERSAELSDAAEALWESLS